MGGRFHSAKKVPTISFTKGLRCSPLLPRKGAAQSQMMALIGVSVSMTTCVNGPDPRKGGLRVSAQHVVLRVPQGHPGVSGLHDSSPPCSALHYPWVRSQRSISPKCPWLIYQLQLCVAVQMPSFHANDDNEDRQGSTTGIPPHADVHNEKGSV